MILISASERMASCVVHVVGATSICNDNRQIHGKETRAEIFDHPACLRSRATFAALPRNSAISTGPSENSPAFALAVRTRK